MPIGLDLGPRWLGPLDAEPAYFEVITDPDRRITLPPHAYRVWRTAFSAATPNAPLALSRRELIDLANRSQAPAAREHPADVVGRLIATGLLTEITTTDPDDGRHFLRRYQMSAAAEGLGNTPTEPDRYTIGRDSPVLLVDEFTFSLWASSSLYRSVLDAATAVGVQLGLEPTLDYAYARAAAAIPALVSSRCAILRPAD